MSKWQAKRPKWLLSRLLGKYRRPRSHRGFKRFLLEGPRFEFEIERPTDVPREFEL